MLPKDAIKDHHFVLIKNGELEELYQCSKCSTICSVFVGDENYIKNSHKNNFPAICKRKFYYFSEYWTGHWNHPSFMEIQNISCGEFSIWNILK